MNHKQEMKYLLKGSHALLSCVASVVTVAATMGLFNELGLYFKITFAAWLVFFNWKVLIGLVFASLLLRLSVKAVAEKIKEYEDAKAMNLEDILNMSDIEALKKAKDAKYDKLIDSVSKRLALKIRKALTSGRNSVIIRVHWAQPFCPVSKKYRARIIQEAQSRIYKTSKIWTNAYHYGGYSTVYLTDK